MLLRFVGIIVFLFITLGIPIFFVFLKIRRDGIKPMDRQRAKCESPIEIRLYDALKKELLNPITQYPMGRYRIDIAFPKKYLAIECDGKHHLERKQQERDWRKDSYLKQRGWKVLRYSGHQIYNRLPQIVREINGEICR